MTITKPGADAAVPPPAHPRRWAGLAVLSASLLLITMDITILNVALPAMSADLRPDSVQLLWIVDVYALVVSGLLVTVAALGDRWGRRRMLLAGFTVFGLASAGILVTDGANQVIAIRALLGLGGAMIMPSTLSMIRHLFTEPKERATALGVWAATAAVGSAVGPIVGGALLEHFSWHSAFLVNVPVMVVAIVAGMVLLPESRAPRPGRWDAVGTVLSIAGMVALVYAIKHFGKEGFGDPGALAAAAIAVVLLPLFVVWCLRVPNPILEVRLFGRRAFSAGSIAALCTSLAVAAVLLLLAQWMQLVEGHGPLEAGVRLLPAAVGAAIVSPAAPWLAGRIGTRTVLAGGLVVSGSGFLVMAFGPRPLSYATVAIALALVGAGMGSLAIASAVIMVGAPPEKAGSAAAVDEVSYELGAALGVAVLGSVAAAVYRADLSFPWLAERGVTGAAAADARESLGGAMEVARHAGPAGAEVMARAQAAFTTSLEGASLAGGALMVLTGLLVWWLAPRDLDVSAGHH
ncbi:MFS transporter [Spirillospora sp. NPDC029432]|uniref:MFS transporter n=1 Tax=Spirillospora sp. NPDC029432 TaxID=3154599 RepID=UPI0034539F1C